MIKRIYQILFLSNKTAFFKSLLLDREGKYAFIEIPKSGCSSVKRALLYLEETEYNIESQKKLHKNKGFISFGDSEFSSTVRLTRDKVFAFSIVRNPYTRILSAYLEKIEYNLDSEKYKKEIFKPGEKISFVSFLKKISLMERRKLDRHFMPQSHIIGKFYKYTYIGYLENIDQDLKGMIQIIFPDRKYVPSKKAPHSTNSSKKHTVLKYYNLEATNLVKQMYKDDFDIFGYSTEIEDISVRPGFQNKILVQDDKNIWKNIFHLTPLFDSNLRGWMK